MILRMANPWKHPRTGMWHLRQKPPVDVRSKLTGKTVTLPVGQRFATVKVGNHVQVSLGTSDREEARALHAAAEAVLFKVYDGLRKGPLSLSQRQIVALAGISYKELAVTLANEPGKASTWANVREWTKANRPPERLEAFMGSYADELLGREGLTIDDASRARLLDALADAQIAAANALQKMAEGDYTPDPQALRFPEWQGVETNVGDVVLTVGKLFDRWKDAHTGIRSKNTIHRYHGAFNALKAFFGTRSIKSLTPDDIWAWMVHRRDVDGIAPRTVNRNDRVAASSVFHWATLRAGGKILTVNPVEKLEKLPEPKTVGEEREKPFRDAEWKAILTAAKSVVPNTKRPYVSARNRWCPWILAHTAARISSITRLLKSDVRDEGGIWVIDLRQTKTGKARSIPLHPQLIEEGFLAHVDTVPDGAPLFYAPDKEVGTGKRKEPFETAAEEVSIWIRTQVELPPEIDPNHAWRHTWKSRALGIIDPALRDWIALHGPRNVARGYESPSVALLKREAIDKFPAYVLDAKLPPSMKTDSLQDTPEH